MREIPVSALFPEKYMKFDIVFKTCAKFIFLFFIASGKSYIFALVKKRNINMTPKKNI